MEPVIFDTSVPGRVAFSLPALDVPAVPEDALVPPGALRMKPPRLPEVSEGDVIRHTVRLSHENYCVDTGFYPLGSCTMKYNPKVHEEIAGLAGFLHLHPLQPEAVSQGALRLLAELEADLREIAGMDRVSLQTVAGAQGELVGLLMIRAYHEARGDARRTVLIPDSAHGTNPASARLAGCDVVQVRTSASGEVALDDLTAKLAYANRHGGVAAIMLTNPNTLGLFERDILRVAELVHQAGGLLYLDGANLNAIVGLCRPGDMGFDVVHFNLHKTFTTPHGGGGPGAGPVGVKAPLVPYLPAPLVEQRDGRYFLDEARPQSIGRVQGFYGNFGILVRAWSYIRRMGPSGLRAVAEDAILNANYLQKRLEGSYSIPYHRACMHEFILSCRRWRDQDLHAWDMAKRLLDYGFYAPTVNFPLIVEEAMMIEPTETESREMLDRFCEAMLVIAREADEEPEMVRTAPHTLPVGRVDEVRAARHLNLRWQS